MRLSEFLKVKLSENNYKIKDVAKIMDYQEQSFRNKFAKNRFGIDDIVAMAYLTDERIIFINGKKEEFELSPEEFISLETRKNIDSFKKYQSRKITFDVFFESLPVEKRAEIFKGSFTGNKEEYLKALAKKESEGTAVIESTNFKSQIAIYGLKCNEAAEWLKEKNKSCTAEEEELNIIAAERFFNVMTQHQNPPVLFEK